MPAAIAETVQFKTVNPRSVFTDDLTVWAQNIEGRPPPRHPIIR